MGSLLKKCVRQGLRPLVSLALIALALTMLVVRGDPRSYNVDRIRFVDLGQSRNGYMCGYDKYLYVSKYDSFVIVDVTTGDTMGPIDPEPNNQRFTKPAHGKVCMSHPPAPGEPRIHLILPNRCWDDDDASIWVFDVHDWGQPPVLKGLIWSEDLDDRVHGGALYSAFVDTSLIRQEGAPVWVFAVSNTCKDYWVCNDTVYIFNIREILDAPVDDPDLPIIIDKPDTIWYPGINPGFPPGPDQARGHDVTVHGGLLLVTNPGGGLYVVDTGPLFFIPPQEPLELGRCEYEYAATHDAWISKYGHYIFTTDEQFMRWGCHRPIGDVTVYDISGGVARDLCAFLAGKYAPSTAVTSHYCYIREDLGYVANYSKGLRIIDVSDPEEPVEVGYYDTYLGPDRPSYVYGTVDVWPFYRDLISACDHDSGVFVLRFRGARKGCLSGYVKCASDQSPIGGAWVYSHLADRGACADENGYYELKTAKDPHTMIVSALGFSLICAIAVSISEDDCTGDMDFFL